MASSNIKLFDENKGNMLSDSEFSISNQRMNGLQTGVASSQLQNKAMYQVSLVAYAIAQVMMQNGLNANDTDAVSTFVSNLSRTMLQKVYDIATTEEAQAGVATGKWMSPALTKTLFNYMEATTTEAQEGTNNAKWMSPALVKAAIDVLAAKAQNILSDETKTLFGLVADAVPDDAFNVLIREPNENLLVNADFRNPIDTNMGYVVPPGLPYLKVSDYSLVGNTDKYYPVAYIDNASNPHFYVDGVEYYVDHNHVSQAYVRGYTGAGETIDGWAFDNDSGNATILLTESGIKFVNSSSATGIGSINQKLPPELYSYLAGKTITISMLGESEKHMQVLLLVNGSVYAVNSSPPDENNLRVTTLTATLPETISGLRVYFYGASSAGVCEGYIHAAKLELGSQQTLAYQLSNGEWMLYSDVEKLRPNPYEPVGSIKLSARTDIGDSWLLCNGETITQNSYPELSEFVRAYTNYSLYGMSGGPYYGELSDIACYNGVWVAVGRASTDNNTFYPYIFTTTDLTGAWTAKRVWSNAGQLYGVYCYNGTWVAVGAQNSSVTPYAFVTSNPTGDWTAVRPEQTTNFLYKAVTCYNGTWAIVGYTNPNSTPYIFATTNPTGAWSKTNIDSSNGNVVSIDCYNGLWVAGAYYGGSIYAYTATSITGPWTKNTVATGSYTLADFHCHNGVWVAACYANGYPFIFTTTDPAGTWTVNALPNTHQCTLSGITYCNGKWVASGYRYTNNQYYGYVYTAENPLSDWMEFQLSGVQEYMVGKSTAYGSIWASCGKSTNSGPGIFHNNLFKLPTISLDGAYAYIKAKE